MFEKEIKFITDFSLNKIKKLGAFFTFEQLQSLDLHPSIIKYINAELDYLIFQDRQKLLKKSAFDYTDQKIQQYFDAISQDIKKNKRISFEDAKSLIMQAASFTANYIVRPKWSLTKFIYNEDQLKSTDEIKLSLNYLYYYDYLGNVLLSYLEKKKALNLSLIDFEVTLNKINKELFGGHSQQLINNSLVSMADFFNIGGTNKKISLLYVELFLKEKDLIDYLFRVRRSLPVDARQKFEIAEIKKILYTPTKVDDSEIAAVKEQIEEEKKPVLSEPEVSDPVDEQVKEETETTIKEENEELPVEPEVSESKDQQLKEKPEIEEKIEKPEEDKTEEKPIEIPLRHKEEEKTVIDEISDEEYFNLPDNDEKETEENTNNPDIEFEEKSKIDEEDILSELSADDELLEAFDSQLKALEEESKLFIGEEDSFDEKNEIKEDEFILEDKSEATEEKPDLFGEELESVTEEPEDKSKENAIEEEGKTTEETKPEIPLREKDVFSYLSDKEIDKIVDGVFNEDREDFANTMEKISECITYEEATEILKSVFFSYRVNPYTRDAVTLTNAVSNYFKQI
jgi:hypothetical protein